MNNKYYKKLDVVRLFSCISILLYHVGILKGGYLAVCTFFVLSGYLAVTSGFRKEKFSFKDYYLSRIKKIYVPLLIVVFISIASVFMITNINWINLKPETTSILFGYNNYWQLNANLDYFVRYISSPFMHLWYISILIQFEIVFPILFIVLKKIGEKVNKLVPCIILIILGLISYWLFYKTITEGNIMLAYYSTFTRLFSLLFGLLLGFIHEYYQVSIFKNKKVDKLLFFVYIFILMIIFILVDVKSYFFNYAMITVTLITMRLIDYGTCDINEKNIFDKIVSYFSSMSYEIYLVQYPVIFLFQKVNLFYFVKILLIVIITLFISFIIHSSINIRKRDELKILKIILLFVLALFSSVGLYKYITAKDYTKDMKKLEEELAKNRLVIKDRQKEYDKKEQKEKDEWEEFLSKLDNSVKEIGEIVKNLSIVGIGDSIMEMAINDLYNQFPNGYFDAKVNRTEHQAADILIDFKNRGILKDIVLLNLGTNGDCSQNCKDELMKIIGDRKVFWVNATNPDYESFNPGLDTLAKRYDNVHIVDWVSVAKKNPEYLYHDRVHPTVKGSKVYVETIYKAIYEEYLKEFNEQKEKKIKEHEDMEKRKITFIGNDLLLGIYDYLQKDYNESEFIIDEDFNYQSLIKIINNKINDKNLSYNIVLVFDKNAKLNDNKYKELIELCNEYNLYIVNIDNSMLLDKGNVINFYDEINNNNNYIEFDNIHLTDKGNAALAKSITSYIKK